MSIKIQKLVPYLSQNQDLRVWNSDSTPPMHTTSSGHAYVLGSIGTVSVNIWSRKENIIFHILTRKVNLKADVGKVYPPVTFVWFNDDQEIESAKGQDSVSLDVNALDNDKYISGMIYIQ